MGGAIGLEVGRSITIKVIQSRENERRRKNIALQRKKDEKRMERARIFKED